MKTPWRIGLASILLALGCTGPANEEAGPAKQPEPRGKQLMSQYCGACHAVPSPSDLDKKTWQDHILVRMAAYMGIFNDNVRYYDSLPEKWLEPGIGGERVKAGGIYPSSPVMSRPDWEELRKYILAEAPQTTFGSPELMPIQKELPLFKARVLSPHPDLQPLVTAVRIDSKAKRIRAAYFQQALVEIDGNGKGSGLGEGIYGPVFLDQGPLGHVMADIGSMRGSDHPKGKILVNPNWKALQKGQASIRFDSLMRPVMAKTADLDGDGDLDWVIAEFGYHFGELAWHEAKEGQYIRHILFPDDGTVSIALEDFDQDGDIDILSLKANADERIDIYLNDGNGNFEGKMLFRFNPTYGCTAMEVTDWNGDGKLDFLVANGDNGDYPPILKANHGIRLFLNQGGANFKESQFLALNGAYGLRVRDFDLDGDPDIAAVSFYPDYKLRPEEAFVFFENQGNAQFQARSFPEVGQGRWMVMDAGDLDGDGDEDIVLGAFSIKSDDCSEATYNSWIEGNVALMLLENQTK